MVQRRLLLAALMLSPPAMGAATAQVPTITLAEAIRRAERVQPAMVRATSDVRTAEAQRRSAMGAYLPRLSASSSASDFFSEGASRIDPITGELTGGNSSNRSISTSRIVGGGLLPCFAGCVPPQQDAAEPSFKFKSSDFWAQGINVGLAFRF